MPRVGEIFRQIGKFVAKAVGGSTGKVNASVLNQFGYQKVQMDQIALAELIAENIPNEALISFFFLDAEGAEYTILPLLISEIIMNTPKGPKIAEFCQINAELHLGLEYYGTNKSSFEQLMQRIVAESPYLPLSFGHGGGHLRTFLINVRNPQCYQWFFRNIC